jgi:hypothetical protein
MVVESAGPAALLARFSPFADTQHANAQHSFVRAPMQEERK